jgi:hypothetical protein
MVDPVDYHLLLKYPDRDEPENSDFTSFTGQHHRRWRPLAPGEGRVASRGGQSGARPPESTADLRPGVALRLPGWFVMRTVFTLYVLVIAGGLALYITVPSLAPLSNSVSARLRIL